MIPVDKSPLQNHGNADDSRTTLTHEDFGDPKPVPEDYYHDQNHRDSQQIMCWVIIGSLVLGLVVVIAHFFTK